MDKINMEAQTLLSNPEFNVAEFVKVINIHYQNKYIVKALGTDAHIVLGLIESNDYQFLEICPQFISPKIFEQIHKDGYEVWHRDKKEQYKQDSVWYGVIINENLALHYRALGTKYRKKPSFEVIKGTDGKIVKQMRKRWKGVKMRPYGEKYNKLPVYQIRTDIWNYANDALGLKNSYQVDETRSDFYFQSPHQWTHRLKFSVFQSGKQHIRVEVCGDSSEFSVPYVKSSATAWTMAKVIKKFKITESELPLKVINWAVEVSTKHQEFLALSHNKIMFESLKNEKVRAGLK